MVYCLLLYSKYSRSNLQVYTLPFGFKNRFCVQNDRDARLKYVAREQDGLFSRSHSLYRVIRKTLPHGWIQRCSSLVFQFVSPFWHVINVEIHIIKKCNKLSRNVLHVNFTYQNSITLPQIKTNYSCKVYSRPLGKTTGETNDNHFCMHHLTIIAIWLRIKHEKQWISC